MAIPHCSAPIQLKNNEGMVLILDLQIIIYIVRFRCIRNTKIKKLYFTEKYTNVALETDLPDELQCQVSFDLRGPQKVTIAAAQKCIACN